jgi:hypothetical protein
MYIRLGPGSRGVEEAVRSSPCGSSSLIDETNVGLPSTVSRRSHSGVLLIKGLVIPADSGIACLHSWACSDTTLVSPSADQRPTHNASP